MEKAKKIEAAKFQKNNPLKPEHQNLNDITTIVRYTKEAGRRYSVDEWEAELKRRKSGRNALAVQNK